MKPLCKLDIVPCNLIIMDLLNRCMCSFFSSVSHYHLFMMQYQCHKRLRIQQLSLTSSQVQGYFCAIWPRLSMKLGSLNLSSMQLLLLIAVLAIRNNYRMWYIVMLIFFADHRRCSPQTPSDINCLCDYSQTNHWAPFKLGGNMGSFTVPGYHEQSLGGTIAEQKYVRNSYF